MLGNVTGELGLRKYLEENGHTLVVTSSKDGPDSVPERESTACLLSFAVYMKDLVSFRF